MFTQNQTVNKQLPTPSQAGNVLLNGYFYHSTSASINHQMSGLIRQYGLEFYGAYWILLEQAKVQSKSFLDLREVSISAPLLHIPENFLEQIFKSFYHPGKGSNEHLLYFDPHDESNITSYFPHPIRFHMNNNLLAMILKDGLQAYGLYWIIMERLCQQPQAFLSPQILLFIQQLYSVSGELMTCVMHDYELFYYDEELNLHSKEIDNHRVCMEKPTHTQRNQRSTPNFNTREGQNQAEIPQSQPPILNKEINKKTPSSDEGTEAEEEEKTKTEEMKNIPKTHPSDTHMTVVDLNPVTPAMRPRPWEEYFQEAMSNDCWYEIVAQKSDMAELMRTERAWITNYFFTEIVRMGNTQKMNSVHDVQQYFAHYTSPGKRTTSILQVELRNFVMRRQKEQRISPYEEMIGGKRAYGGHPIPDYAPPRPSSGHIWDDVSKSWTR